MEYFFHIILSNIYIEKPLVSSLLWVQISIAIHQGVIRKECLAPKTWLVRFLLEKYFPNSKNIHYRYISDHYSYFFLYLPPLIVHISIIILVTNLWKTHPNKAVGHDVWTGNPGNVTVSLEVESGWRPRSSIKPPNLLFVLSLSLLVKKICSMIFLSRLRESLIIVYRFFFNYLSFIRHICIRIWVYIREEIL